MANTLSDRQLQAISDIERACSVFSLVGCVFIIVTFCSSSSFHKPINRLVFYASFGNIMTNVGTLMSRSYLSSPLSGGCQLQAFLIQLFMPADAFWTLAMAFNVYLTFYHKYDARRLRRMEIPYLLICYGVPFVPAFTYIFIQSQEGGRMYGNATLWCWITSEWDVWRIATFYGPVWVVILLTMSIYLRAGRMIYEKRKQLNKCQSTSDRDTAVETMSTITMKTTEVTVTSEDASSDFKAPRTPLTPVSPTIARTPNYSVHISAETGAPAKRTSTITLGQPPQRIQNPRRRNIDINRAAWAYTKCSILFFTAMLITWIPSSANRVYSFVHNKEIYPPLEIMSAFVLPLQGFWNACIYMVTSWGACKSLISDLQLGNRPEVTELVSGMGSQEENGSRHSRRLSHKGMVRLDDTESMAELATTSRATSQDGQTTS